ncbi:caspase family protein [Holophaga foetida]|uniref:caspase family protein n=1 Tax=Holophaga foetida TaxID=35839 RepID=UPI0002472142|nr:caspase family protein [Holophaga foetida]
MRLKALLCGMLFFSLLVRGAEPPTVPLLRLEIGTHLSAVKQIGIDAAGRWAVTAGLDKTVRVWDLQTRRLAQTLRPPIGSGNEGQLYACAISPDGRYVAAAGWTGWDWDGSASVYVFDRAAEKLVRRVSGLPNVINQLGFSPDGTRLALCLHSGHGIRVLKIPSGEEAFRDTGYGQPAYGLDFDASGRLATTCYDGKLRLYDPSGRKLAEAKTPGGGNPFMLRFSPDGQRLAVGFQDAAMVSVHSGSDLSFLYHPDCAGTDTNLMGVAWSLDGQELVAGGRWTTSDYFMPVRIWGQKGRGVYRDLVTSFRNSFLSFRIMPDGRLAAATWDGWGFISLHGRAQVNINAAADFRDRALSLDRQGGVVGFTLDYPNGSPWRFELAGRRLVQTASPALRRAQTTASGLDIKNWLNGLDPSLNGKSLGIQSHEISRALAFQPDAQGFLLGAEWTLYAFDRTGQERWRKAAPALAWTVNVSGDGAVGMAGYADGTLRWHRMSDGQELMALYVHTISHKWILWTPSGYYDAAPGAEDLIGWHLNRDKEQAADFFPASRFRNAYYRPDVIDRVLETLDEAEALRMANDQAGMRAQAATIEEMLPPVVRILSPETGARVKSPSVALRASVRHPRGLPIDEVWAAVDGRQTGERGIQVQSTEAGVSTLSVTVPSKDCVVSVFARSGSAISEAATVRLVWDGDEPRAAQDTFTAKPKLYVLTVGVGRYARKDLNLKYPAKDARDVAASFKAQQGRMYREVETRVLTDEEATKDNILDGLEWIQRATTARDVAVVFLAGHGVNDPQGQFFFLPHQADLEKMRRTLVADSEVKDVLSKVPGKVLFFLDSCHSGNVLGKAQFRGAGDVNRFVSELASAENGVVVFTASTGRQASQESPAWGNGAFTKALLEGLEGRADFTRKGAVTVNMLDLYLSERVKELTKGTQSPVTVKPSAVPDFPIVMMEKR